MKKIGMVSLGCPKNLADSEEMLGILKEKGYEITPNEEEAEVIIVNTCGFIETAKQEAINTILEMADCKNKGKCEKLVVTGCLAERYKEKILEEMPEVDAVVGTGDFRDIADIIEGIYKGGKNIFCGNPDAYLEGFQQRIITSGYHAYLKIAEGCDNFCTYCIIPKLRGKFRSRKMETVLEEAEYLVKQGIKEIIVIAQDTTKYGMDLYGKRSLAELLRRLEDIKDLKRIRFLYCYPDGITDELIDTLAKSKKICRYIDLPIQHASNKILKRMGRRCNIEEVKALIKKLRERIPGVIIRTSLIAGFPGETEEDFAELKKIVEDIEFDRLGVFAYSAEEDTPAALMENQIPQRTKKSRQNAIMRIQKEISLRKNKEKIGMKFNVLVEGIAEDGIFYYGRSFADAPDIDGKIYFTSEQEVQLGEFIDVHILDCDEYDLVGEGIIKS